MTVQFLSREIAWTEPMKELIRAKISDPLRRHLRPGGCELSVFVEPAPKKGDLEMRIVLRTDDGRDKEIVRRQGGDFAVLANEVSNSMRSFVVNQSRACRRFLQ